VPRKSITSALLMVVFSTSAFVCASGWSSTPEDRCPTTSARNICRKKSPGIRVGRVSACGNFFRSQPAQCSLRSFAQFRSAAIHRFEMPAPLLDAAGKLPWPANSILTLSSIGPSETDRGPPHS
jgi:hypothetical protein